MSTIGGGVKEKVFEGFLEKRWRSGKGNLVLLLILIFAELKTIHERSKEEIIKVWSGIKGIVAAIVAHLRVRGFVFHHFLPLPLVLRNSFADGERSGAGDADEDEGEGEGNKMGPLSGSG
ncbi:unnamed protein product [Amaranthus hypochondriacus]